MSVDNTSRNHRHSVAAVAAPQPGNRTSKEEVSQQFHPGCFKCSCLLSRQRIRLYNFPRIFETRMPMTIYTQNQNQNHPVMMNTGLHRTPESPGTLSQASTILPSPPTTDLAKNVNAPVPGWPTLAKTIAKIPDLEAFASFTDLNIKSLLYYQAELISLRKALHEAEYVDYRKSEDEDASLFAGNLTFLIKARDESIQKEKPPPKQWIIIEKIRTTLEKYSKPLSNIQRKHE